MFIHFTGQGRDVMINMKEVKEIDFTLAYGTKDKIETYGVRFVMVYPSVVGSYAVRETNPVDGDEVVNQKSVGSGMHHFDFKFVSPEIRNKFKKELRNELAIAQVGKITLPELPVKGE